MPGLPLAAALIDLFYDHAEGAGQHEGRGNREQPLARLGVDTGGMGAVQEDKCPTRAATAHSASPIVSRRCGWRMCAAYRASRGQDRSRRVDATTANPHDSVSVSHFHPAFASRTCKTWMALASCPARDGRHRSLRRIRRVLSWAFALSPGVSGVSRAHYWRPSVTAACSAPCTGSSRTHCPGSPCRPA